MRRAYGVPPRVRALRSWWASKQVSYLSPAPSTPPPPAGKPALLQHQAGQGAHVVDSIQRLPADVLAVPSSRLVHSLNRRALRHVVARRGTGKAAGEPASGKIAEMIGQEMQ